MREGLILQHAPTGPPGRLGAWARARGLRFAVHASHEVSPATLDPSDHAWIASLGSAHSAKPTAAAPDWIAAEVALLRRAVDAGVPVLGLCWGGQALAAALGARVGPAPFAEKGWLSIDSVDAGIPVGPWLHYHSEIFEVPEGAEALARSPAGPSAFRLGPHLGLQFHPEADAAMATVWANKDPEQTPASRARLAAEGERFEAPAQTLAFALFDAWYASAIGEPAGADATLSA